MEKIINKWLFGSLTFETVFKLGRILLMEMDEIEMSVTWGKQNDSE